MKITLEKQADGPFGRYFFPCVLLAGAAVILVQVLLPPSLQLRCPFHCWTGLPCPVCGATRCVQRIFAGEFSAAWRTQPLVFAALFVSGGGLGGCALAGLLGLPLPRVRFERPAERRAVVCAVIVLAVANWIYLIGAR
jgi:hypothetical protein